VPYIIGMWKRGSKAAKQAVTRVIAYVRVSTEKQADEGVSLDAQRAQLAAYAGLYGLQIVETIVDAGESAKSLQRPGLARALAMLADGLADGLLVTKLDRLTRSVRDLGELIEGPFAKAALLSVGEQIDTRSAAGRLVLNVLASVSQWEREAIGERTSSAMQHMRASGEYTGGRVPYGWTLIDGGKLEPVEDERATVARARELRATGLSLASVARALAAEGRLARNGREFFPMQISNMLDDDANAA
jgi:site-specific DNA recombinase